MIKNWLLSNTDICFVSETHLKTEQKFGVPPMITINNPYQGYCKKPRGGISCLIQPNCTKFITDIDKSKNDMIILTLLGGHKISSNYIPPVDSSFFKDDMFSMVANQFEPESNDIVVLGGGDVNSRVADLVTPLRGGKYRENPDTEINSHGRFLAVICNSFKCYPLNNLTYKGKQFDGKFTYYKDKKKSQNDIVLGNRVAIDNVESFTIHELSYNPSDHFPVTVKCNFPVRVDDSMCNAASDLLTNGIEVRIKREKKIRSTDVDWNSYERISNNEIGMLRDSILQLADSPSQSLMDTCLNKLSKSLHNVAKTCSMKQAVELTDEGTDVPFKHLLDEADESLARYLGGVSGVEDWHAARSLVVNENKKFHFSKEAKKWTDVISKGDSKELWNKINWKGEADDSKIFQKKMPPSSDLAAHFLTKGDAHEPLCTTGLPQDQYVEVLDQPITHTELYDTGPLLKEKSTCDGWCPQMVTSIHTSLYPLILILFNVILSNAFFPIKWCKNVVAAIFKNKGSADIAKFFRPITLVQMLYKWFDFILLERFKRWFIPADEQTAYQDEKGCPDHIFLMRCLISFAKATRKKLYICTIDFDGAFDRVSRNILLKKLALRGAGSIFLFCIASMYKRTESVIIQQDNHFTYELLSGIKQGLPLSPYLFIFYIDDIFEFFYTLFNMISNTLLEKIHLLIHADDANIIASSRDALIQKIQRMLQYCNLNMIKLQLSKCMFFVVNGTEEDRLKISVDDEDIPSTTDVVIVGTPISDSGNLQMDLNLHLKLRFKNCIKYFNYVRANRLAPTFIKLKVLMACVTSTLLHNCETFGPKLPKGIETLYFQLIKSAMNVRPNTPNFIVLIESGLLPIRALVLKRQLKWFRKFKQSLRVNSARKIVLDELSASNVKIEYLQHYISLDEKYRYPKDIYAEALSEVQSKIRTKASDAENHYRFYVYLMINPDLLPSPFLSCVNVGDVITRFRCGSHNLPIETGRWRRIPRQARLCPVCHVMGDESHVLFNCSAIPRTHQINVINQTLNNIWKDKNVFELFKELSESEFMKFY